jgi:cytochrome d ubiquinol oxidase subunit II
MELTTVWFVLIAVLWIGYFVLEGFDFGVGMLLPVIGRNEPERRALLRTIGPVWDGNEVWLIVAGGATFAAFPEWYATLFSGFYLALFVILVALIVRGVGIEYRNKRGTLAWRNRWDTAIAISSLVPALLWGVAFANIVAGTPIDANGQFQGGLLTLINPFGLLGGLTTMLLFQVHGLMFLTLKTEGEIRERARARILPVGLLTAVVAVAFLAWATVMTGNPASAVVSGAAVLAFVGALLATRLRREAWAFIASSATIAFAVASLFTALFPDVMPSSLDPAWSLTTTNAASTPYTLAIMTVVAVIFVPLVLLYQGWTYWVFRKRVSVPRTAVEA